MVFVACPVCAKVVLNQCLKKHLHTHTGIKYVCSRCKRKYVSEERRNFCERECAKPQQTYTCTYAGCTFTSKYKYSFHRHTRLVHECEQTDRIRCPVCPKTFKSLECLKMHLRRMHEDQQITLFKCTLCKFFCDNEAALHVHKRSHEKDYQCPEPGCSYTSCDKMCIKDHLGYVHDVGDFQCTYCLQNCYKLWKYKDPTSKTTVGTCRRCYNKHTNKTTTSRIEEVMSTFLDKHFGTDFLVGSDKSLVSLGGCSRRRPDKLYMSPDLVMLVECDEHQHMYSSGSYTCEEQRLTEIYDDPCIMGKPMIVVRFNPHKYRARGKPLRQTERLQVLLRVLRACVHDEPVDKIHVYYLFYNRDNPHVTQNIRHTFIDR